MNQELVHTELPQDITIDPLAQINDEGWIALKYNQPAQVLAQRTVSGYEYAFIPKASISMAWVNPEDVQELMSRYKTCCGGNRKKNFLYANVDDVRRWTNGGGA